MPVLVNRMEVLEKTIALVEKQIKALEKCAKRIAENENARCRGVEVADYEEGGSHDELNLALQTVLKSRGFEVFIYRGVEIIRIVLRKGGVEAEFIVYRLGNEVIYVKLVALRI